MLLQKSHKPSTDKLIRIRINRKHQALLSQLCDVLDLDMSKVVRKAIRELAIRELPKSE